MHLIFLTSMSLSILNTPRRLCLHLSIMYCRSQSAAFLFFFLSCNLSICTRSLGSGWPLLLLDNSLLFRTKLVLMHDWYVYFSRLLHRLIPFKSIQGWPKSYGIIIMLKFIYICMNMLDVLMIMLHCSYTSVENLIA